MQEIPEPIRKRLEAMQLKDLEEQAKRNKADKERTAQEERKGKR